MNKPHSIIQTKRPLRLTKDQYLKMEDEYIGVCRWCGTQRGDTEGDAEGYTCSTCYAPEVYGIEELIARGEVEIINGD